MTTFDCVKFCPSVGKCCRKLTLAIEHTTGVRELDYMTPLAQVNHILNKVKVPFKVLGVSSNGIWLFTCKVLGKDGLCTKYDQRPEVCRIFEPGNPACLVSYDFVSSVKKAQEVKV